MKRLGKLLLALIILLSSVISNFIGFGTKVEAVTFFVDEATLREKDVMTGMITYNGEELLTTYVYYLKDGVEYPAYCISPGADGVGEYGSYTVTVDSLLNDVNLWRVITNGYPYKSAGELGCNNANEAFVATKQAVYCAIYGRDASWYGSLGASGDRVINAMAQILSAANSSSASKPSGNIEIIDESGEWAVDSSIPNYISKTFSISASTSYDTYTVSLSGNLPEDVTILDMSNNPKKTYSSGTKFKIAIPTNTLNTSGSFNVNVNSKLKTKPVLFGRAPAGTGLQNYALTASIYEDAQGSKTLNYSKNNTKLEILKQDEKTLAPLKGVEFRILDKNKKPVYTDLITDAKGKVTVTGLTPGKYYLEETKTLDGYVKYDELIAFDLAYNQVLTITVNNSLEKTREINTDVKNINVNQKDESINVKIKNENENINKNKQSENIEVQNKNININQNLKNEEIKTTNENNNENINKTNKKTTIQNGDTNKNINLNKENISKSTNIINKNTNKNVNIGNQDISIVNNNENTNTNIQNGNTNINNQNNNTNISSLNGVVKLPKTGM